MIILLPSAPWFAQRCVAFPAFPPSKTPASIFCAAPFAIVSCPQHCRHRSACVSRSDASVHMLSDLRATKNLTQSHLEEAARMLRDVTSEVDGLPVGWARSDEYGSSQGGTPFDDYVEAHLFGIKLIDITTFDNGIIWKDRDLIKSIGVEYAHPSEKSAETHGRPQGDALPFVLDDRAITHVTVSSGSWIDAIDFETSDGEHICRGGPGGSVHNLCSRGGVVESAHRVSAPPGTVLKAFFGSAGDYIDRIGFIFGPALACATSTSDLLHKTGAWRYVGSVDSAGAKLSYSEGRTISDSTTRSSTWSSTVSKSFQAGFGVNFWGMSASTTVSSTTAEQIGESTVKAFSEVSSTSETKEYTVPHAGTVWQWSWAADDKCGHVTATTGGFDFVTTPGRAHPPCCLPGLAKNASDYTGACEALPGDKVYNLCDPTGW
eukprot:COSAG02_NODE_2202_length_9534_cov_20.277160_9_plen_433_part_00